MSTTIGIRKTKLSVLCKRLNCQNPFDVPLILTVAKQLGIVLPDNLVYLMEIWTPMIPRNNRKVYEINIIVNGKVESREFFIVQQS